MANKIKTYSDFQQFMDDCCTKANANPDGAPHRRWWRRMTYDSFIRDGTVLGLRIVAPGDPANSNMVKALQGDPPFDPAGQYGQMPPPPAIPFEPSDMDEIKDWIQRGCPNQ
jgi:hypothetical protein